MNMTLAQWIPLWLENYKRGTMKSKSYHQYELLIALLPDELTGAPLDGEFTNGLYKRGVE